jgi:anti-sigma-K factor RskA
MEQKKLCGNIEWQKVARWVANLQVIATVAIVMAVATVAIVINSVLRHRQTLGIPNQPLVAVLEASHLVRVLA